MSVGNEFDKAIIDQLAQNPENPFCQPTLTVREIPNSDFSGYLDQSVLMSPTPETVFVRRAWEGKDASIEFGHLVDSKEHQVYRCRRRRRDRTWLERRGSRNRQEVQRLVRCVCWAQ